MLNIFGCIFINRQEEGFILDMQNFGVICILAISSYSAAQAHVNINRNYPPSICPSLLSLCIFYLLNKYSVGVQTPLDWQPLWTPQKASFFHTLDLIGWAISPSLARLNLSIFWPTLYLYISVSLPLFLLCLHVSVLIFPLIFFFLVTPHFITFSCIGQNTYF